MSDGESFRLIGCEIKETKLCVKVMVLFGGSFVSPGESKVFDAQVKQEVFLSFLSLFLEALVCVGVCLCVTAAKWENPSCCSVGGR